MKNWTLVIGLFCLGNVPSAFSKDAKLYMPLFEVINSDPQYQYSISRLFRSYVEEYANFVVTMPKKSSKVWQLPSKEEIQKEASKNYCGYFLIGDVNQIGEKIIVSVSLYNTHDGSHIWGDRQKINNPNDVDLVLEKLAKGMAQGGKANEQADIYNVTEQEQKKLRKINVRKSYGISMGGVYFPGELFEEKPFYSGAGIMWIYDARMLLFEVNANWYSLSEPFLSGVIGLSYPFFPRNVSPYLDLGMGLSIINGDNSPSSSRSVVFAGKGEFGGRGLISYLGGGLIVGRTSTVGIRVRGRYFMGLYKMNDEGKTYPHGIMFNLDIFFGR